MTPQPPHKVKVAYILGSGHSGSTLLDLAVGQLDGFFSAGELHADWDSVLGSDQLCGCRQTIQECPIWKEIFGIALGPSFTTRRSRDSLLTWQEAGLRARDTPKLLAARMTPRMRISDAVRSYARLSGALYSAISRVTGARVIVDSSKESSIAALLALIPSVDPYYIHLVRDSRAVDYAYLKRIQGRIRGAPPDRRARSRNPRSHGPARTSLTWLVGNLLADAVVKTAPRGQALRIRYEDLASVPDRALRQIAALVGEPTFVPASLADRVLEVETSHTLGGNDRTRFRTGRVEFRLDEEWLRNLPILERRICTLLTAPLLLHYGYPVRLAAA